MIRKIVHINEEKCDGCGICVDACHERAIEIVNGKAKLVSDTYCDGLGDCLNCPQGAIEIIEREAGAYDDEAVKRRIEDMDKLKKETKEEGKAMPCGCPGTMAKKIERKSGLNLSTKALKNDICDCNSKEEQNGINSELSQWPVQLRLVNPTAPYFEGANLLIAADCTAYAYANFHRDFIKDHITVIGCPKLDDNDYYREKLAEILKSNNIKSITVVRMEVPCCSGIVSSVKNAMLQSQTIVPYREVMVGINGELI